MRNSITITKSYEDRGSLCLRPMLLLENLSGLPLTIIEKEGEQAHSLTLPAYHLSKYTEHDVAKKIPFDHIIGFLEIFVEIPHKFVVLDAILRYRAPFDKSRLIRKEKLLHDIPLRIAVPATQFPRLETTFLNSKSVKKWS